MDNTWKKINSIKFSNCVECLQDLKKNNFKTSPWIDDIVKRYNYKFDNSYLPIKLVKKKVSEFGFTGPTELQEIYKKTLEKGFKLVPPEIAIYSRFLYSEQKNGEWLRFATPFESMIDSDGVPHLPKIGKALGLYFIETFWSYPKAIFHPHNEFIFIDKD